MPNVDLHEIRASLKLIRGSGDSQLFENRGGVQCPVCGEVFDEVLETTEQTRQFTPPHRIGLCLVNDAERVILFTHA